jgi:hypothetical protein
MRGLYAYGRTGASVVAPNLFRYLETSSPDEGTPFAVSVAASVRIAVVRAVRVADPDETGGAVVAWPDCPIEAWVWPDSVRAVAAKRRTNSNRPEDSCERGHHDNDPSLDHLALLCPDHDRPSHICCVGARADFLTPVVIACGVSLDLSGLVTKAVIRGAVVVREGLYLLNTSMAGSSTSYTMDRAQTMNRVRFYG